MSADPKRSEELPASSATCRVAIVDDHELVRKAFEALMPLLPGYVLHFTAEHGEDYIRKCKELGPPDIALVDLLMEVMDGWVTIAWIREHQRGTLPLAITIDPNDDAVRKVLVAGGCGVLPKSVRISDLQKALDDVRLSGFHRNSLVQKRLVLKPVVLAEAPPLSEDERIKSLSKRERETLVWMCDPAWLTYPEIALKMNVKPSTVESNRKNIYFKLQVNSRGKAVDMAIAHKLVRR